MSSRGWVGLTGPLTPKPRLIRHPDALARAVDQDGALVEALTLMKACSQRAQTGIGNHTLIAVLWRSGVRISEALERELRASPDVTGSALSRT